MMKLGMKLAHPSVRRLHIIARLVDKLSRDLDQVPDLKDCIGDKRRFREVEELTKKARTAVASTRFSLIEYYGPIIAEEYKGEIKQKGGVQGLTPSAHNRMLAEACPGHDFAGGDQISPTHVRWWCTKCGGNKVTESRPVPHG